MLSWLLHVSQNSCLCSINLQHQMCFERKVFPPGLRHNIWILNIFVFISIYMIFQQHQPLQYIIPLTIATGGELLVKE